MNDISTSIFRLIVEIKRSLEDLVGAVGGYKDAYERNKHTEIKAEMGAIHSELRKIAPYYESEQAERGEKNSRDIRKFRWERIGIGAAIVLALLTFANLVALWMQLSNEKEQSRNELRAYVFFDRGEVTVDPDNGMYQVSIWFKNTGQTPAYNVTRWWDTRIDGPEPFNDTRGRFSFNDTLHGNSADIGSVGFWEIPDYEKEFPLRNELPAIKSKSRFIYVWGEIKYRDVFQRCEGLWFYARNRGPAKENTWQLEEFRSVTMDPPERKCNEDNKNPEIQDPWKEN